MSDESSTVTVSGKLLDEEQQVVLQNIARLGTGRTKGRAVALLTLDEGASRAEAGDKSGLSLGQIKYVLATFKKRGLAMFARYTFSEAEEEQIEKKPEVKAEEVDVAKAAKNEKKKPKKKKKSKGKDKKMAKKGKKPKRDKKQKTKAKVGKVKKEKKGKGKKGKKGKK
jgi:hypothetical protein